MSGTLFVRVWRNLAALEFWLLTLTVEVGELWSTSPAIPCGDVHQSFTDALVIIILALSYYIFQKVLWRKEPVGRRANQG